MGNIKNLTGSKIGLLTLLDRKRENNRTYYYCKCDCGSEKWVRSDYLKNAKSCGCLAEETQFKTKDITNKRFGKLIVIEQTNKRDKNNGSVIWKCKCDCGNYTEVASGNLVKHEVKSCGCLSKEVRSCIGKNVSGHLVKYNLENNFVDNTNLIVLRRHNLLNTNTSGTTGVCWDQEQSKWRAYINFKGKSYKLGRYANKEDAIKVRKEAEEKLHKQFLRDKGLLED